VPIVVVVVVAVIVAVVFLRRRAQNQDVDGPIMAPGETWEPIHERVDDQ
jgi:hypothetical protein